jgi:hypothetical protein
MRNDLNAHGTTHTKRPYDEQFQVLQRIWRAIG